MSGAAALLQGGDLSGLRTLFADRVRAEPAVAGHRMDLADVLIVRGELERADAQLDLAATQDPAVAVTAALARQLVRAAVAREDCFAARRPPELVGDADAGVAAAVARLAGLDAPSTGDGPAGTVDGRSFAGIRDGDDRTAEVVEVLTSTGKYMWLSWNQVAALSVRPPERLRDLVWRQAELEVRGGPSGVVYLPAIYPGADMTDGQRLGRETAWVEDGGTVRGLGLRTWLVGEEALALGEFAELAVVP